MNWNPNQKNFLRLSITKRSDGRLDVAYLNSATSAATTTADTLDEAIAWLEMTHGETNRVKCSGADQFEDVDLNPALRYWYHPESSCLFTTTFEEDDPRYGDPLVEEVMRADYERLRAELSNEDPLDDLI